MMSRWLLVSVSAAAPVALNAANTFAASLRGGAPSLPLETVEILKNNRHLGAEDPMGGSYDHLGCFKDDQNERILGFKTVSADMSAMMCHTHCDSKGAAYMATKYGNECWCSLVDSLEYSNHAAGTCDMFCEGEADETCGGSDAFDLYKMEWAPASSVSEYVGCFADSKGDGLLGHMMVEENMATEVCREHCMTKATDFYATQYGNVCWCGTSPMQSDYERHGQGICHMRCAEDDTVACGGYNAFSLFKISTMVDGSEDMNTMAPTSAPTFAPIEDSSTYYPHDDSCDCSCEQPTPAMMTMSPVDVTPSPIDDRSMNPTPSPVVDVPVETPAPVVERQQPTATPSGGGGGGNVPVETPAPVAERQQPTATPSGGGGGGSVPVETPAPVAERQQPTATTGGGGGGGNVPAEYADLLALHNQARCMHNADPLEWDSTVFAVAEAYAAVLTDGTNCGSIFHSNNGYGENLYFCGSTDGDCYSAAEAMQALYNDELTNNVNSYGGHATAILWKATKRVGCAVDTCESGDFKYHTLVCNFDPPGNFFGATEENVELPSKSAAECAI